MCLPDSSLVLRCFRKLLTKTLLNAKILRESYGFLKLYRDYLVVGTVCYIIGVVPSSEQ